MPSADSAPTGHAGSASRGSVPLVWLDCEMTGLDLAADALVEVACVVTDAQLQPLDDGFSVVVKPPQAAWEGMSDFVTAMHDNSGLLPLIHDGIALRDAEDQLLAYVRQHVPEERKAPLAGSSVYVDRMFLARDMPRFDAHLHYRIVDVSSLKELVRRWYPKVYFNAPEKTGNHRALGDVLDSIAELAYYRETVFSPAAAGGAPDPASRASDGSPAGTL